MADDFADIVHSMPNPAGIAAANATADPDKTATAIKLGAATGTPTSLIEQDPDRFQQQLKARTAGAIVNQNPQLKSYILSDPNAAKVSSDDLAQLDTTSKALQGLGGPSLITRAGRVANATVQGFEEGFDKEGFNKELKALYDYSSNPLWQKFAYPFVGVAAAGLGGFERIFNGAFGSFEGFTRQGLEEAGADPDKAASFASQVSEFLQFAMAASGAVPEATGAGMANSNLESRLGTSVTPAEPGERRTISGPTSETTIASGQEAHKLAAEMAESASKAAPYIESGHPVPPGLDKTIDGIKDDEAKAGLDQVKEAFKESLKSTTRDRSPEMFKKFVEQHTGEENIGVSAETVAQLYGGKEPAPDDGILGFVPNIAEQFKTAMETGADVQIPFSDFMTYLKPEIFDQIEPGLRTREDLPTEIERTYKAVVQPKEGEEPPPNGEPKVKPMFDSGVFDSPKAIALPQIQARQYVRAIQEQQDFEYEKALERARKAEAKRLTPEWEANRKEMEKKVVDDLAETPKYLADLGIRQGHLPKIDASELTVDQKAQLHRAYYGKDGEPADYVASLTGHDSGDSLVDDLAALHHDRAGKSPDKHLQDLVRRETDYRMEQKYGRREDLALEGARELTLHKTNLDLMHANLEELAKENGLPAPASKEELYEAAKNNFGNLEMGQVSSDGFWMAAYRASQRIRNALLNNDPTTAFKAEQEKWSALVYAKEATRVEKVQKNFDKLVKKYTKGREIANHSQEYVDQIQTLLQRIGIKGKRSLDDIQSNIEKAGWNNFQEFVDAKTHGFADLNIPPFLMNESWAKPVGRMTTDEFEAVAGALKSMDFNARFEKKVLKGAAEAQLDDVIDQMVDHLKEVFGDPKARRADKGPGAEVVRKTTKAGGWVGIQPESIFNRYDQDDPHGLFNQYIVRPITEGANYKARLLGEYQRKLNALGDIDDINKIVDNKIFRDANGDALPLTRRNVLGVLQHMGNDSNFNKLIKGWKIDPEEVRAWVTKNTTKEDWDRAQGFGAVFEELFELADRMSYDVSGLGIVKVPLKEFVDPFGVKRTGWYHPIEYDRSIGKGPPEPVIGANALEDKGYRRATTNQRHTVERTGYNGPVQLSLDSIEPVMRQYIHDIAMRPAVIQANKFFENKKFMDAIKAYHGEAPASMFRPWLKDIANFTNTDSPQLAAVNNAFGALTRNTVGTLIGLNPGTVLKHFPTAMVNSLQQVGPVAFAREASILIKDSFTGRANWRMAMEKSDELARRMNNFFELIKGNTGNVKIAGLRSGAFNSYLGLRDLALYMGQYPVAVSDLISSVPTWLAEYKKQIALGTDEGNAKFIADRAVRQAHGSSVFTNKPEIMRIRNPVANSVTQLYGFFNEILQKQYQIGWRIKDSYNLAREGDIKEALGGVPKIASMLFFYGVMPTFFEELASGFGDPREGALHRGGRFVLQALSSTLPFLRDISFALMYAKDPSIGLFNETAKGFTDVARDIERGKFLTAAGAGKFLRNITTATGYATGLANAQEGKMAEYITNYLSHKERPHNVWDWMEGLRYGKTNYPKSPVGHWLRKEL